MKKREKSNHRKITIEKEVGLSSQLTLFSNREAFLEGCKEIEEYDDTKIKFSLGTLSINFCGKDLVIENFGDGSAVISGEIADISFG